MIEERRGFNAGRTKACIAGRLLCDFAVIATLMSLVFVVPEAHAVPSFARQTGMQCSSCHTAFPQLSSFGRSFKLNGYTISNNKSLWPPVAVMLQGAPGFTHTGKGQGPEDIPSRFSDNDNLSLNQVSFFYAGRLFGPYGQTIFGERVGNLVNKIGVFAQGTWDGVEDAWAWDNMEIRAAQPAKIAGKSIVLGVYVNNNPTLQDLWNTTPAWGFPFSGSGLAPSPDASPLLSGGVSQQVVGFGGYGMLENLLYLEVGGYTTLSADTQEALGVDPTGEMEIDGFAPYWRVAVEKTWGLHVLELGTYGLYAQIYPGRDNSAGHDYFTDLGFDLQYQWSSRLHDVTMLANWLHETQDLNASRPLGLAEHGKNDLWTASLTGSYLFDKIIGIDVQYFQTAGDADSILYENRTGRPDSNGWIFQINYLPINKDGGPSFWPYSNVKLSLQYTLYHQFNGSNRNFDGEGRDASDNNTLFLEAWFVF